uniref:Uncharacterized protein n=1 Tax=Setaria viridis TaxID=4556 RepID=A0A4V6D997_SETVI|nr:hypothetical protein SEVIR_3G093550v2 [Setaria viridis]
MDAIPFCNRGNRSFPPNPNVSFFCGCTVHVHPDFTD